MKAPISILMIFRKEKILAKNVWHDQNEIVDSKKIKNVNK